MEFYVDYDHSVYQSWVHDNQVRDVQYTYGLVQESVVVDAGGYQGDFTNNIYSKYGCSVHVLEPIQSMYEAIKVRFLNNTKILVDKVAMSNTNSQATISLDGDSSSLFVGSGNSEIIDCVDACEYLTNLGSNTVDLLKLNIEGAEYDVLEHLIQGNWIPKIKNIQIQFHRFIPDCANRRSEIRKQLAKTHTCTWNYEWIWESWTLI